MNDKRLVPPPLTALSTNPPSLSAPTAAEGSPISSEVRYGLPSVGPAPTVDADTVEAEYVLPVDSQHQEHNLSAEIGLQPSASRLRLKLSIIGVAGLIATLCGMYAVLAYLERAPGATNPSARTGISWQRSGNDGGARSGKGLSLVRNYYNKHGQLPDISRLGVDGDLDEIHASLSDEIDGNNLESKYLLGLLLYVGGETHQDRLIRDRGGALLRAAAEQGLFIARLDSAILLGKAYDLDDDHYRATRAVADRGVAIAQIELARYFSAIGRQDEAVTWAQKARASFKAGSGMEDGLIAFRLALHGNATSKMLSQYEGLVNFILGMAAVDSDAGASDPATAESLLMSASERGIAKAVVNLAKLRLSGTDRPEKGAQAAAGLTALIRKDPATTRCVVPFEECADKYAQEAMYLLAINHLGGTHGFEAVSNAVPILEKLVEKNHVQAKSLLGWCLLHGAGTKVDVKRAFALLSEASDDGDKEAKYWLARSYLDGKGTAKDKNRAKALLTEAAALGKPEAINLLNSL